MNLGAEIGKLEARFRGAKARIETDTRKFHVGKTRLSSAQKMALILEHARQEATRLGREISPRLRRKGGERSASPLGLTKAGKPRQRRSGVRRYASFA